jgi:hypothetical protein
MQFEGRSDEPMSLIVPQAQRLRAFPSVLPTRATRDIIVVLSETLGPRWSVHRETDYNGEVPVIALPIKDDATPAFILYEKEGVVRVATVKGDDWEGDQCFRNFQHAVAAIIAETACWVWRWHRRSACDRNAAIQKMCASGHRDRRASTASPVASPIGVRRFGPGVFADRAAWS